MAIGIGTESGNMFCVNNDVDYYRYKYRDYENQIDGSRIDVSFVSPVFSIYERSRFYLLQMSELVDMKSEWKYRPDYISYEYYGTTSWWQLILWINDIKSLEYFDIEKVLVPTIEAITHLQNESYEAGTYIDINEDAKHTQTLFTLYKPAINNLNVKKDNSTLSTLLAKTPEVKTQAYCETFTMDIPTLRLRYVDLQNIPIEKTIRLNVKSCSPSLIYNKHYTLINDPNDKLKRLTWDPKILNNAGLLFKLKEKDELIVQYVSNV